MTGRILFTLLILACVILIDFYVFKGVRVLTQPLSLSWRKSIHVGYWVVHGTYWATVIGGVILMANGIRIQAMFQVIIGGLFLLYAPKILFVLPMLLEDTYRLIRAGSVLAGQTFKLQDEAVPVMVGRRQFISQLGLALAAIPFVGVVYGLVRGKYQYTVHKLTLRYKDLPDAFDGLRLVQLSDIHVGSFDDPEAVQRGIDLVNAQNPDVFVFTGDLVNNIANEMQPWLAHFQGIQAKLGKFSVIGNHDYGDYWSWPSEDAKAENFKQFLQIHEDLGFQLLRNEHALLEREGQKLALVGVENWSASMGFPRKGDLNKASGGLEPNLFKVLLSHDPTHWRAQVIDHPHTFHLTLSGHTHGMQFGFEIPGLRWSPAQFRYREWAGLYEAAQQKLYVNRGFGFLGFHGRVGIWPEVTVITLEKDRTV